MCAAKGRHLEAPSSKILDSAGLESALSSPSASPSPKATSSRMKPQGKQQSLLSTFFAAKKEQVKLDSPAVAADAPPVSPALSGSTTGTRFEPLGRPSASPYFGSKNLPSRKPSSNVLLDHGVASVPSTQPDVPVQDDDVSDSSSTAPLRKRRRPSGPQADDNELSETDAVLPSADKRGRSSPAVDLTERAMSPKRMYTATPTSHMERKGRVKGASAVDAVGTQERTGRNVAGAVKDKPATAGIVKGGKYTPLEQQFMQIKQKYPDTVLFVECGYKYKFFDKDASIASKVLNIYATPSNNFLCASIPVHRLQFHLGRLVNAGHKVGVVSQTETAALKAASANKSQPFARELTALYTPGTMVPDTDVSGEDLVRSEYLVCILEGPSGGRSPSRRVHGSSSSSSSSSSSGGGGDMLTTTAGSGAMLHQQGAARLAMVAVQVNSGNVVYDVFDDDAARSELETRLQQLVPSELLLARSSTPQTRRMLQHLMRDSAATRLARMEEKDDAVFSLKSFLHWLSSAAAVDQEEGACSAVVDLDATTSANDGTGKSELQDFLKGLPTEVQRCVGALGVYLRDYKLESVLMSPDNYQHFTDASRMVLNGPTLSSLEIHQNSTTGSVRGSLLWILGHTQTPFGARLLKKWVSQPLLDAKRITHRLDAVEELAFQMPACLLPLFHVMKNLTDLDRLVARVHFGRAQPAEVLQLLKTCQRLMSSMPPEELLFSVVQSSMLRRLLAPSSASTADFHLELRNPNTAADTTESWVNRVSAVIASFLECVSEDACVRNQRPDVFVREADAPVVFQLRVEQSAVRQELDQHLRALRKHLGRPSLEYVTRNGVDYLLELPVKDDARVPVDWQRVQHTKQVSRWHTPTAARCVALLQQQQEKLTLAANESWARMLHRLSGQTAPIKTMIQRLATLDCLYSLAITARNADYCKPQVLEEDATTPRQLHLVGGRNPIVEQLQTGTVYVPNDVHLDQTKERCMIITGPNMGGKSCYIRQVALTVIMAQIGSFVPAESCRLTPFDAVFTRMGSADNLMAGQSTFFMELQQTSQILQKATAKSLVILDELGRGTSTMDGCTLAASTLKHFISNIKATVLFVTHYWWLTPLENEFPGVCRNYHMAFLAERATDADTLAGSMSSAAAASAAAVPSITFLYKLVAGPAQKSYGLNVARLAGVPESVIARAAVKASWLERQLTNGSS